MVSDLHWLRPAWLLALLPVVWLLWLAWRQHHRQQSAWRSQVDAHLLAHLVDQQAAGRQRWPLLLLAVGWLLVVVTLAGPVWQRVELPLYQSQQATVLVLNLSPSMTVRDESPDRLSRARHKIHDLITELKGSQLALLIYADSPFVAAPLTDDGQVILNMLPELSGDLMPPLGERADLAITRAGELLAGAGAAKGRILLITPGLGEKPEQALAAAKAVAKQGYSLNVLGLGSDAGGAFRDRWGRSQLSRHDSLGLAKLAATGHGHYARLSADDSDWQQLLSADLSAHKEAAEQGQNGQGQNNQWQEQGHWLLLLPLLLAPLTFRRGWLALLLTFGVSGALFIPTPAAASWLDWWQTPDQQASQAFAAGDYQAASAKFNDPAWAAAARYRAGDYQQAAAGFAASGGVDGQYNAANALARAGDYQQAVAAYDEVLKAAPEHENARFNRDLVAKLLQQQNQQNQQQEKQQGDQQQDNQGEQQQQQGEQQGNQGEPEQQDQSQSSDSQQQQGDQQQGEQQSEQQQDQQQHMDKALAEAEQQKAQQAEQKEAEQKPAEAQDEAQPVAATPITAEEQAREQLLRQVPDDHTGLLRARIYHHYRNSKAAQ